MTSPLDIRPVTEADLPGALRLSTQAGWNQLEQDWRRLVRLWPKSSLCACDGGTIVATATLACHGPVGWIGMVLVDESQRGRGIGGEMFRRACACAASPGVDVTTLGLDATDLGRPVYLKQGFADHSGIERWSGPGGGAAVGSARGLRESDWSAVLALDQRAVGVDRSALLRELAGEPGAVVRVAESQERVIGVAFSRPGRTATMIGPVIAESAEPAVAVSTALLSRCHGTVYVDVLEASALSGVLAARGFRVARKLVRMSRPRVSGPLLTGAMVFAGAGFELG